LTQSDVAVPETTGLELRRLTETGLYDPDLDFRKLIAEAGEDAFWSQGFRLVSKDDLLGVPHIVVSVTYREGFPRAGVKGDYVSVEAVVADADLLHSAPVMAGVRQARDNEQFSIDDLPVFQNEAVVYNDGSTGIRRTLTEELTIGGVIDPGPEGQDVLSRFDRQIQRWSKGSDLAGERICAVATGRPYRHIARRGLRKSEYTNEYGDAVTFYFA
jgi:hypothetical protein